MLRSVTILVWSLSKLNHMFGKCRNIIIELECCRIKHRDSVDIVYFDFKKAFGAVPTVNTLRS